MIAGKEERFKARYKANLVIESSSAPPTYTQGILVFDQVGHETMYASSANKHFFTK